MAGMAGTFWKSRFKISPGWLGPFADQGLGSHPATESSRGTGFLAEGG
jgi:hypothetical protein